MALYKIQTQSPITYDSYGNPLGTPVVILEDLFHKKISSLTFLLNSPLKSFHVTHVKRFEWNSIDSSEYSILHASIKSLEEIVFSFPTKVILMADGLSAALSLQLSLNVPNKIYSSYLFNPEMGDSEKDMDENPFKEFWDWFSQKEDFLLLLPKTPYIFDFYLKYKKFMRIIASQEQSTLLHFLYSSPLPYTKLEKIKLISPKSSVSIVDLQNERSSFDSSSFQKLILWFAEKDHLQILKE